MIVVESLRAIASFVSTTEGQMTIFPALKQKATIRNKIERQKKKINKRSDKQKKLSAWYSVLERE